MKDKVACQGDELKTDDGPTSSSKESRLTLTGKEKNIITNEQGGEFDPIYFKCHF